MKTRNASYLHEGDFFFGDVIKIVIVLIEVRRASFKIRCRFINKKSGQVYVTGYQSIAYTNMKGMPTRLPARLKVLLTLTCRKNNNCIEETHKALKGREIFQHDSTVTIDMTNAETNVSHHEYAKLFTDVIKLFMLKNFPNRHDCTFKVVQGNYSYIRDFYFNDTISTILYLVEANENYAVFKAEFCDKTRKVQTLGWQKMYLLTIRARPKACLTGYIRFSNYYDLRPRLPC